MEKSHLRDQHSLGNEGYPKELFISDPSDMFKCSICDGIFNNAMTCTNQLCGNTFCHSCIKNYLVTESKCPSCKCDTKFELFVTNQIVNNFIRSLQIRCETTINSNEKDVNRCAWTGKISELENHLDSCCLSPYRPVFCPNACTSNNGHDSMKTKIKLSDLFAHLSYCPNQLIDCPRFLQNSCDLCKESSSSYGTGKIFRRDFENHMNLSKTSKPDSRLPFKLPLSSIASTDMAKYAATSMPSQRNAQFASSRITDELTPSCNQDNDLIFAAINSLVSLSRVDNNNSSTSISPPATITKAKKVTKEKIKKSEKKQKLNSSGSSSKSLPCSEFAMHDWKTNYLALLEYLKEFGHCNVAKKESYECMLEDDLGNKSHFIDNLGKWLHCQKLTKIAYPLNTELGLSTEQDALLQSLVDQGHMVWETVNAITPAKPATPCNGMKGWNRHFAALRDYCKEFGHGNVPKRDMYKCVLPGMGDSGEDYHYVGNLGRWLADQRQARRGTHGSYHLTAEREAQLQQLVDSGFLVWDAFTLHESDKQKEQGEIEWSRNYAALLEYGHQFGHCNVPFTDSFECVLNGEVSDGGNYHYIGYLGKWLQNQRQANIGISCTKLSPEREEMLSKLVDEGKLSWDAFNTTGSLVTSKSTSNGANQSVFNGSRDENGTSTQLALLQRDDHDYDHENGREDENEEYDEIDQRNMGMYGDSHELMTSTSTAAIVTAEPPTKRLKGVRGKGSSAGHRQPTIKTVKVNLNPIPHDWEMHYGALLAYCKEHGHCNVSKRFVFECDLPLAGGDTYHYVGNLGRWLCDQRQAKRGTGGKFKLYPEREALLQKLVDEGKLLWIVKNLYGAFKGKRFSKSGDEDDNDYDGEEEDLDLDLEETDHSELCNEVETEAMTTGIVSDKKMKTPTCPVFPAVGRGESVSETAVAAEGSSPIDNDNSALSSWKNLSGSKTATYNMVPQDWNIHYAALLEFYKQNGHCNVPLSTLYECDLEGMGEHGETYYYVGNLGTWLSNQRQAKNGKGGRARLSMERDAKLQMLVNEGKLLWDAKNFHHNFKNKPITSNRTYDRDTTVGRMGHNSFIATASGSPAGIRAPGSTSTSGRVDTVSKQSGHEAVDSAKKIMTPGNILSQASSSSNSSQRGTAGLNFPPSINSNTLKSQSAVVTAQPLSAMPPMPMFPYTTLDFINNMNNNSRANMGMNAFDSFNQFNNNIPGFQPLNKLNTPHDMSVAAAAAAGALGSIGPAAATMSYMPGMNFINSFNMSYLNHLNTLAAANMGVQSNLDLAQAHALNRTDAGFDTGRTSSSSSKPIKRMNSTDTQDSTPHKNNASQDWNIHFAALLEYYKAHGTCNVPLSALGECDLPEGFGENGGVYHYMGNLGAWLHNQRQAKHGTGNRPKLSPERDLQLQQLVDSGLLLWDAKGYKSSSSSSSVCGDKSTHKRPRSNSQQQPPQQGEDAGVGGSPPQTARSEETSDETVAQVSKPRPYQQAKNDIPGQLEPESKFEEDSVIVSTVAIPACTTHIKPEDETHVTKEHDVTGNTHACTDIATATDDARIQLEAEQLSV